MNVPPARSVWLCCLLVLAAGVQACSKLGTLTLHNNTLGSVEVYVNDEHYIIQKGETAEINVDPLFGKSTFLTVTSGIKKTYRMPAVGSGWIKSGLWRATVFARIDNDGSIYIYPANSDKSSFFERPPPSQPTPFPLKAQSEQACRGGKSPNERCG
jgi:hypothetical protein